MRAKVLQTPPNIRLNLKMKGEKKRNDNLMKFQKRKKLVTEAFKMLLSKNK
jgi:hypothetical protein